MPTTTKTRKLYTYDQLGPKGKQAAIEWYRDDNDIDCSDRLVDIFDIEIADYYGLTNCKVMFSLGNCQGDGVAIKGNPNLYRWAEAEADKDKVEPDDTLRKLLDQIAGLCLLAGEDEPLLSCTITHHSRYCHSNSMDVTVESGEWYKDKPEFGEVISQLEVDVQDWCSQRVKEISQELTETGYAEIDYQNSDEAIAGMLQCNDYRFTRRGEFVK